MNEVDENRFDNKTTLAYKWSQFYQVPARYLHVSLRDGKYVYESYASALIDMLASGEHWEDISATLFAESDLTPPDIILLYYHLLQNEQVPLPPGLDALRAVNNVYYHVDKETHYDRISDLRSLNIDYRQWLQGVEAALQTDTVRYEQIVEVQERLFQLAAARTTQVTALQLKTAVFAFHPTIYVNDSEEPVTAEHGMEIFADFQVGESVPYLRYNSQEGDPYLRLYTGERPEDQPNYEALLNGEGENVSAHTLYFLVYTGERKNTPYANIPREAFSRGVYRLDNNHLTIELPAEDNVAQDTVLAVVSAALPMLSLGSHSTVKVNGVFDLWHCPYDETTLLDSILLDFIVSHYLYVEETMEPQPLKKRLDINFRPLFTDEKEYYSFSGVAYQKNSATVSVTLAPRVSEEEGENSLPQGTSYIRVNVKHADSADALHSFLDIFTLLLDQHLSRQRAVLPGYRYYLPELSTLSTLQADALVARIVEEDASIIQVAREASGDKRSGNRLDRLKAAAPDLFVAQYAHSCQSTSQPFPLAEDEAWPGEVLTLPVDGKVLRLACDNPNLPHPGLKPNEILSNKDMYPYIPCCYSTSQMENPQSYYARYKAGVPPDKKAGAKAGKKIRTNKILSHGGLGFLPEEAEKLLVLYSVDHGDISRCGVDHTANSFLHSVCLAVEDADYLLLTTEAQREKYVRAVRRQLPTLVAPYLLRQELHDFSETEILALLTDTETFFDPDLFFRAVEEAYNVNVYVFTSLSSTDDMESAVISPPRYRDYHCRNMHEERGTIIIYKNYSGSKSSAYPQCELVVDIFHDDPSKQGAHLGRLRSVRGRITKVFPLSMQNICHSTLLAAIQCVTCRAEDEATEDEATEGRRGRVPDEERGLAGDKEHAALHALTIRKHQVIAYDNPYTRIDHRQILQAIPGLTLLAQTLDDRGKLRFLHGRLGEEEAFSIFTLPSAPENLPSTSNIYKLSAKTARATFGAPHRQVVRNGAVMGYWYQVFNFPEGAYIPLLPHEQDTDEPLGSDPFNFAALPENLSTRWHRIERTFALIVGVIRWMYRLFVTNELFNFPRFQTYFTVYGGSVSDSSTFYDLRSLRRRLPYVVTLEDGLQALEDQVPSLVHKGRLVLYNQVFAEGMFQMIKDYHDLEYGRGVAITPPIFLPNFYHSAADFPVQKNTLVFLSLAELNKWRQSAAPLHGYMAHKRLHVDMSISPEPYVYVTADGRLYLIQNVQGRAKNRALYVAATWAATLLNPGYNAEGVLSATRAHLVYGISNNRTFELFEDHSAGDTHPLEIVYYGTLEDRKNRNEPRYAAALRLL